MTMLENVPITVPVKPPCKDAHETADLQSVPISPIVVNPVDEKMSALPVPQAMRQRAERASSAALEDVLNKVPRRTPLEGDA